MLFIFQHCLAIFIIFSFLFFFFFLFLAMDFQVCISCLISSIMFSIQLILLSPVTENEKPKEGRKGKKKHNISFPYFSNTFLCKSGFSLLIYGFILVLGKFYFSITLKNFCSVTKE